MKRRTSILLLVAILAVGTGLALAGGDDKAKAVEGTLVDTACYLGYGAKANDHGSMKGCGAACAKGGSPVGILTAEGKYVTLGVPAPELADYVGQTLRATGEVKEGVLLAKKLEVKKGDAWQEVKLGPAM